MAMFNLNERQTLYCMNNALWFRDIGEDNSIDLTVTSPPYDGLRSYDGYVFNFDTVVEELYRVTKPGGVVVWVVGDGTVKGSESGTSFRQALTFMEQGFNLHDTMIYRKDNPAPVGGHNRYYQAFEYMFVFSVGTPKTFNPITRERRNKYNDKRTERVKSFTRDPDGTFTKKYTKINETVKVDNIWSYVVGGGSSVEYGTKHPAAFPEKLASDHILSWSNEGDMVLDPFVGSGTTGIAAAKLNRRFIGVDCSEEYINLSLKRMMK